VIIPTLQSTAIDRAPSAQRAAVMATWTGAARLGQAAGPLIAAAILSRAATTAVLMVGAAASAALAIAFALSPVSRRREPA
jgi:predicted MFS family arabinose efflux permease